MFDAVLAVLGDVLIAIEWFLQTNTGDDLEDWMVSGIVAGMAVPAGIVAVKVGFDRQHRSWIVEDTPTERVRSIAASRTELKGAARPFSRTYPQPFADGECVHGRWRVQEYVEKEPHDDENDEMEWETIASGTLGDHVVLEDDTGAVVLANPSTNLSDDAATSITRKANEQGLVGDLLGSEPEVPAFADFLREHGVSLTSEHRRRYQQWVVEEGTDLYVLGQASPREEAGGSLAEEADVLEVLADAYEGFRDDLVMERDDASGEYIVSDRSEAEIAKRNQLLTLGLLAAGVGLVVTGAFFAWRSIGQYGLL